MAQSSLVLVTGSSGRIGQAVVRELKTRGLPVRGFDRTPTPGLDDCVIADITDGLAVRQAAQGVGTLIHLAATPDDDDFLTKLLGPNIVGVYHVMEAAHLAGVRRIILASSGQVVWGQRSTGPFPVTADVPITPRYWYAAAKAFLEAAGRAYADAHHIPSVLAVRLGWCPRTPEQVEEIRETGWAQDVYLSPRDAGRFFACATLATREIPFAILYATSKPARLLRYDLATAKDLIGYEPQEQWPQGIEEIVGTRG
jgi:nucleoside-diphosphate-sugar epimerase